MNKKIFLISILAILILPLVCADYNFLTANQILSSSTNNTDNIIGNYNNSHIIYNLNSSLRLLDINTLADNGTLSNIPQACINSILSSTNRNNSLLYKLPDNSTVCGGLYYNSSGSNSTYSFLTALGFKGITEYNGIYYLYSSGGTPILIQKSIISSGVGVPALNCYSQIATTLYNNFGVNISLYGSFNQTYVSGSIIQDNLSVFYFKFGNHWFYFEEAGQNTCQDIADSIQEIIIDLPTVENDDRRIIINNDLFIQGKDVNQLYIYTSQDVDIYAGLICNDANTLCFDNNSVCLPNNEIYTGINSSNYLCNNVNLIDDNVYCNIDNITYCAGGCVNDEKINIYGVSYTEGTCYNSSSCTNDCSIEGYTYTDYWNSYVRCGFYDSDACLDWSGSIPCNSSQISENGACVDANYTGAVSGYTAFSIQPYQLSETLTVILEKNQGANPPLYRINSIANSAIIPFTISSASSSYIAGTDCEFKSSSVISQSNPNSSNIITLTGYTTGTISSEIVQNGNYTYILLDEVLEEYAEYSVVINNTQVCVYYNSTSLVACMNKQNAPVIVKIGTYLDGSSIDVSQNNQHIMNSLTLASSSMNPFYLNISSDNITKLNIENNINTGNFYLKQINKTTDNTSLRCVYTTTGCHIARTYYANTGLTNLHNFKDWNICIDRYGAVQYTEPSGISNELSKTVKLAIGLIVPVVIFFLGCAIAFFIGMAWIMYLSGAFSIGLLILFAVIGFVPAWIILVMFAVTAGIAVLLTRTITEG